MIKALKFQYKLPVFTGNDINLPLFIVLLQIRKSLMSTYPLPGNESHDTCYGIITSEHNKICWSLMSTASTSNTAVSNYLCLCWDKQ